MRQKTPVRDQSKIFLIIVANLLTLWQKYVIIIIVPDIVLFYFIFLKLLIEIMVIFQLV